MDLTTGLITKLLRGNNGADRWASEALEILPKYEITTPHRLAGFFAQCGHESADFTVLEENLNYRAETLNKVFPKYFIKAGRDANLYSRQPEKIANLVYADRMGNGNVESGDGYRFRGRGIIQLTGRENYTKFGKTVGLTPEQVIDYVRTKKGALESACWYWKTRNINAACDADDLIRMTKLVNGGTNGLEDRAERYKEALAIIAAQNKAAPMPDEVLRRGSTGDAVYRLQTALGMVPDGKFGPATESAVKRLQKANGLTADGIVGPKTLAKLRG